MPPNPGEGKGYKERAILLYDGIHYDPIVLCGASEKILQTRFPMQEMGVLEQAVQLARDAYQVWPIGSCFKPNCIDYSLTVHPQLLVVLCISKCHV